MVGYVYTNYSGSDLNWIYFERVPEVGRIVGQNWIGSVISPVKARGIRTKSRSDPVSIRSTFARINAAK